MTNVIGTTIPQINAMLRK